MRTEGLWRLEFFGKVRFVARERIHLKSSVPNMAEESNERYPALRLGRLHQLQAVHLHASLNKIPQVLRDDSILFQEAPYLHSTVHPSCRMVSEDGRNYKFSPV